MPWFGPNRSTEVAKFPLSISSNGHYLQTPSGVPFPLFGDSGWTLEVQCTKAQVDIYLANRQLQGFNFVLMEMIEHKFSSQTPAYQNANGDNPFTSITDFSTANPAYFAQVDYIVNEARKRNMVMLMAPAYLGFNGTGTTEGWMAEITADTAGHLQTYGAFLANRYTQPNIIWLLGGDYAGNTTERDKQWNIVTGMRTVRTTDLITGQPARTDGESQPFWNTYAGWNLNLIYAATDGSDAFSKAATAYARNIPFFLIEAGYEGEHTVAEARRAAYQSMFSGACGHIFGNNPLWGFGEANLNGGAGAASAISTSLNTTGAQQIAYLSALLRQYAWQLLVPKTDTSLVTTSLGTGTGRVCPARASDGSFAMIYTPSVNVTVDMTAITHASVRARYFDVTAGTFSTASGSPFANTGTQSFTVPGEVVLVLD